MGNWELGNGIKTENLALISRRFSIPMDWLANGTGSMPESGAATKGLPYIGEVAAGQWLETPPFEADPSVTIPVIDIRHPPQAQYALGVRGTSVNRIAPPGSVLLCLDMAAADVTVSNGDLVIVQRRRNQGGLVEVTAKRFRRRSPTVIELVPDSDDPRWQQPIVLDEAHAGEDEEIAVIALVTGVYRSARE